MPNRQQPRGAGKQALRAAFRRPREQRARVARGPGGDAAGVRDEASGALLATPAAAPDIVQLPRANSAPVTGPKVALMASCVVPAATRDAVKPTFDAWITMVEPVVAKLTSFAGDCEAGGAKAELAGELDASKGVAEKPRTAARFVWLRRIVMGAEPVSGVSLESVHETVSAKLDWSSQASGG
jgi:hypothetical protein